MKAWMIHDDECHGYCRAETRGQAKQFWPSGNGYRDDFTGLNVLRAPWLDGPGPAREIVAVYVTCPHYQEEEDWYEGEGADEREAGNEVWPGCRYDCAEGEVVSKELTLIKLGEAPLAMTGDEGRADG